jgi:hypothetical protein
MTARQDFANYCLRQLGGGIINIELTPEQIEDAVEDSIQFYNEFHFDGIERDYIKYQVIPTKITVASASGFSVNDMVGTTQGALAVVTAVDTNTNIITVGKSQTGVVFAATQTLTNSVASSVISAVTLGTLDNGYIPLPDPIYSVLRVVPTTGILNSPDLLFNVQYQIMSNEIRNITAGSANYLYSTMNYLGHLDFILKKEKSFRFNRRMNKLYFDDSWEITDWVWYVFEVYRSVDPEVYPEVYKDPWLKKYATAKLKRTWGTVVKKYSGMTLPGGVTYNGQQIYDEAIDEIEKLEQEAVAGGAPLQMFVG